jgi:acetyl/propionyl-CoA carboxylase alpha subunit
MQVEHAITEAIHPGLDLIEMMLAQGIAHRSEAKGLDHASPSMMQAIYDKNLVESRIHAIEARVYSENPSEGFKPSPGILQFVEFPKENWLRVDSWVCMLHCVYTFPSNVNFAGVNGNGSDSII